MVARAPGGGGGMDGGGPSDDDRDDDRCDDRASLSPLLGVGEDIVSALPGTNRTTLNYDSIPTLQSLPSHHLPVLI